MGNGKEKCGGKQKLPAKTDAESQQWQPKRADKQSSRGWQYLGEGRETTG